MVEKKTIPWGAIFWVLLFIEIAAYYVSGIFLLNGVTVDNYPEKITYVLIHFYRFWWNEKTVFTMGIGVLVWAMGVSYFLTYYRNYHFDKEHGTSEWEDIEKASKKLMDPEDPLPTYLTQNITVGSKALSNMNILVIGGSGSYKTTSVLTPNFLAANCTNVILDIKGDLVKKHGNYLKAHGVTVKSLNLKSPLESDRYNPFRYVHNYSDLIGLITIIQDSVSPPENNSGDPFWRDGVGLYLQAMFEYEWLSAQEEGRYGSMNNILKLVNMESKKVDEDGTTALQQEMDRLAQIHDEDYPPVRDYRKLKEGATETVRSIIIMVNAELRLFELPEIRRIFDGDDIDIPSLGLGVDGNPNKKTALFLVMRSGDTSYNVFINMFYAQMFRVLKEIADHDCPSGSLPIHVRLIADEFYAGPRPPETEKLLGEIRSRNISIVPVLQDLAQIKTVFPQDKWPIFTGNCAATIYLGSGPTASDTHEWISNMLGDMTIDTRSESINQGMNAGGNIQNSKAGMKLLTPSQVREMPRQECILFLEGYKPIYDKKNLPFNTEAWKESERLAGKNGYVHPVRVSYNEKTRSYRTIECKEKIKALTPEEYNFYKEAEKNDKSIKIFEIDAEEFLYLNWHEAKPSEQELSDMVKSMKKRDLSKEEVPEDVRIANEDNPSLVDHDEEEWNLDGSIFECLRRYSDQLPKEELEMILTGIESGLSDSQIKKYFALHDVEKMRQYLRLYQFQNRK